MNYLTSQKVTLTAVALLTSFALSAQASPAKVLAASQANTSNRPLNPVHRLLFPTSTYMIDDGTAEDAVGFGTGVQNCEALWFNQFDVIPGQETIESVSIAWGSSNVAIDFNGTEVLIAIWSDPNGDGDPRDAVLLGTTAGTIVNAGTDTFVTYPFSPAITLPTGATSFFVGDETPANEVAPEHFWQAIDQNSTLHRQSWVAGMTTCGPVDIYHIARNDFLGIVDDFGVPGTWMIRAEAGDGSNNKTLTWYLRRRQGKTLVGLNWTPANGGSVNVIRNGSVLATTDNDGSAEDNIKAFVGDLVYQVCDTDGGGCSNQVRVRINPHAD